MKTTFNIATYPPRFKTLKQVIDSVAGQVDLVRVFANETKKAPNLPRGRWGNVVVITGDGPDWNLFDNGKFYALDSITEPEYYFTGDDDLIYPDGYVEKGKKDIITYGCIITYHGRIIETAGVNYYYGHKTFRCLEAQSDNIIVDVAGSGVTCFDTRYFHPKGLAHDPRVRMSDLVFSEEAKRQSKRIGCCARPSGWLQHIENNQTIHATESQSGNHVQNIIADNIFKMKYSKYAD